MVYCTNNTSEILLTVGIPTFKRANLLERCLESLRKQKFNSFHVIISDNDNSDLSKDVDSVFEKYKKYFQSCTLYRQNANIGGIKNFFYLLNKANTKYFMWLADDDEITDNYILTCINELEEDNSIAAVCGHWYQMANQKGGILQKPQNFLGESSLSRVSSYIWKANDAFFYGVHRTNVLKEGFFPGYFWPNQNEVLNWAYVFLLNVVISGKVKTIEDDTVQFVNHDYTFKSYQKEEAFFLNQTKSILRRFNVYFLYACEIRKKLGFVKCLYLFPVLCCAFMGDFCVFVRVSVIHYFFKILRFLKKLNMIKA